MKLYKPSRRYWVVFAVIYACALGGMIWVMVKVGK